jgi:hypothetical protein
VQTGLGNNQFIEILKNNNDWLQKTSIDKQKRTVQYIKQFLYKHNPYKILYKIVLDVSTLAAVVLFIYFAVLNANHTRGESVINLAYWEQNTEWWRHYNSMSITTWNYTTLSNSKYAIVKLNLVWMGIDGFAQSLDLKYT